MSAGCTSGSVASALGHGSFAITARHYVDRDALTNSSVRRVTDALSGDDRHNLDDASDLLDRLRSLPSAARANLMRTLDADPAP